MPSHSSTLVREDHSACVSLSPGFPKLLYHPPDLQYPSCYHDEMEEGKMGFPLPTIVTGSRSQRVIPRPAVSVALGKLLAKQIFRSHPRPAESETLMGPHITLKKFIGSNVCKAFPCGSVVKNPAANTGDTGLIPESGRPPGEGNAAQPRLHWSLAGYCP